MALLELRDLSVRFQTNDAEVRRRLHLVAGDKVLFVGLGGGVSLMTMVWEVS